MVYSMLRVFIFYKGCGAEFSAVCPRIIGGITLNMVLQALSLT